MMALTGGLHIQYGWLSGKHAARPLDFSGVRLDKYSSYMYVYGRRLQQREDEFLWRCWDL